MFLTDKNILDIGGKFYCYFSELLELLRIFTVMLYVIKNKLELSGTRV